MAERRGMGIQGGRNVVARCGRGGDGRKAGVADRNVSGHSYASRDTRAPAVTDVNITTGQWQRRRSSEIDRAGEVHGSIDRLGSRKRAGKNHRYVAAGIRNGDRVCRSQTAREHCERITVAGAHLDLIDIDLRMRSCGKSGEHGAACENGQELFHAVYLNWKTMEC